MILRPRVRMMRHPPEYVPREIAAAAASLTHSGMPSSALAKPTVSSAM